MTQPVSDATLFRLLKEELLDKDLSPGDIVTAVHIQSWLSDALQPPTVPRDAPILPLLKRATELALVDGILERDNDRFRFTGSTG